MIIYKYQPEFVGGTCQLMLPTDAKILSFQLQNEKPTFWVLLDQTIIEKEIRYFVMAVTGHEITQNIKKYLTTIQQGAFVWHLFEVFSS